MPPGKRANQMNKFFCAARFVMGPKPHPNPVRPILGPRTAQARSDNGPRTAQALPTTVRERPKRGPAHTRSGNQLVYLNCTFTWWHCLADSVLTAFRTLFLLCRTCRCTCKFLQHKEGLAQAVHTKWLRTSLGDLGGPGGPRNPSKRWGRVAAHPLEWSLGPPG